MLLVGGPSGVGKSTLARELAARAGAALAHTDDFRMALERVLSVGENADLHAFADAGPELLSPAESVGAWRRIGAVVGHALEIVVAHHVFDGSPVVIEGDALLPSFAAQSQFAGYAVGHGLRALYVVEPDESVVHHNLVVRGRDWRMGPEGLERYARATWLYGQWLAGEAAAHDVPVLQPRPWESLAARAEELLGGVDAELEVVA